MTNANEQLVREFCDAWKQRDVDAILAYFADDAIYHNIPIAPAEGLDAIRAVVEMFVPPADGIEFVIHNIFSSGDMVFTERTDRFVMGDKTIELPVAGVFELREGKIAAWRDYFDLQTFMTQSA
ncbi:MAG: limonene-1,2-epoxide hydrolase family protein [Acidimicrobiia bacterium]|jgi:limonene-1,2-epoxide hydrolase